MVCLQWIIYVSERYKVWSVGRCNYTLYIYLQTKKVWRMRDRSELKPQIWPALLTSQRRLRSTKIKVACKCYSKCVCRVEVHSEDSVGKQIYDMPVTAGRRGDPTVCLNPITSVKYYLSFSQLIQYCNSNHHPPYNVHRLEQKKSGLY